MTSSQRVIDVRQRFEFARGHIAGSELVPLGSLARACQNWPRDEPLLLVCRSGHRAQQAYNQLNSLGFQHLSVLPGGVQHWAAQGKLLVQLERHPWSMERQLRFAAGSLVLITLLLAFTLSRYLLIATALIGAGLIFAGATDICMMASLLSRLPWNRPNTPQPRL